MSEVTPFSPDFFYRQYLNAAAAPFLLGVLVLSVWAFLPVFLCLLLCAAALLFLFFRDGAHGKIPMLAVGLGLLTAVLCSAAEELRFEKAAVFFGKTELVSGEVTAVNEGLFPTYDVKTAVIGEEDISLKLRLDAGGAVPTVGERVSGTVSFYGPISLSARGAGVVLSGTVKNASFSPSESFRTALAALRSKMMERLSPLRESAFAKAILFGDKDGLPSEIKNAFSKTGTSHLLAISGLHTTLVLAFLSNLLSVLIPSRRANHVLMIGFALLYIALTGFSPSVARAGVMSVFAFSGFVWRRKSDSVTALFASAAIFVIFRPSVILNVSFLLSYLAAFSILTVAAPLSRFLNESFFARAVRERGKHRALFAVYSAVCRFILSSFLISIVVSTFALPCIICFFDAVCVLTPIFNLLLIPLFTLCLFCAAAFLFCSFLPFGVAAGGFGFLFDRFAGFLLSAAQLFAQGETGTVDISFAARGFAAAAIAVLFLCYYAVKPRLSRFLSVSALSYLFFFGCVLISE